MENVIHLLGAWPEFHSLVSLIFSACAGFIVRTLAEMFFDVVSKEITLIHKRSMAMQYAHFTPDRLFAQKVYMISLWIYSATLLSVGWQGGSPIIFI